PKLWESLSQVNAIHVYQLTDGIFRKSALPVFDFSFLDYKGKPLVYANLVAQIPPKAKPEKLLQSFIGRAQGKPSLTGVLACFPAPVPGGVISQLRNQTETEDAIMRYEAVLPAVKVPFDLLSMNVSNLMQFSQEGSDTAGLRTVFSLVHPDLTSKQKIEEP